MTLRRLDTAQLIAVAAGLGWASGLRLYAVVFLTGAGRFHGLGAAARRAAAAAAPGHAGRQRR
jgi:hypothetical protein